jgi:hypothetical protein
MARGASTVKTMTSETGFLARRVAFVVTALAFLASWVFTIAYGPALLLFQFDALALFTLAVLSDYIRVPWLRCAHLVAVVMPTAAVGTFLIGSGFGKAALDVGVLWFFGLSVSYTVRTYHAHLAEAEAELYS